MESLCLVACCGSVWCAVCCACGSQQRPHAEGWGTRALVRQLRVLTSVLAVLPPVTLLLSLPSWQALADALSERLSSHDLRVGRGEACACALMGGAVVSLLLAWASRSVIGLVVGVLGMAVGAPVWDSSVRRARERALIDEMPEVFRTLAMALGSGETLTQAIEYVGVHERGYAGRAFAHTALRLRCGASTEEAMEALAQELEAPGVGLLTTALVIAQRTGSPLRGLFQSSAQLVERQGEYERMLAVKTAQVRLSVRIVCLLPLLLVALLSLISVDFQKGVATVPGTASVLVAAVMDGCALLIIRRLMRGVM